MVLLLLFVACAACLVLGLRARSDAQVAVGTSVAIAAMTALNQIAEQGAYPLLDDLVFFTLIVGTPATVGRLWRRRADVVAELSARAEALRATREEEAAAAVAEERARVALGVHDALAHRVGEMSLQAGGAARIAGDDPERARDALRRIEDAGRAALDDIRGVIGVLRRDDPLAIGAPDAGTRDALPARPEREAAAANDVRTGAAAPPAPRRPSAGDLALAAAVFVAIAVETVVSTKLEGPPVLNVVGVALLTAPLAFRRVAPLASTAATLAVAAAQAQLLTSPGVLVTPIALLLLLPFTVAAHLPRHRALAGLAVCAVGSLALEPGVESGLVALAAFVAGRAVRDRSERAVELDAVTAELERTRGAHAARRRSKERLRIARELHDAVAHSMTVIVLQAGAAQRVWGRDPAAARVAIDALTGVARATLADLRVTLRGATPDAAPTIDELAARMRPLGLDVVVHREALSPGAERLATAIVQEALTNAARHAAPTTVRVVVARDGDDVVVTVADDGRQGPPPADGPIAGTGTGLQGLAERVAAHGGTLTCGPAASGFAVEARVPAAEAVPA